MDRTIAPESIALQQATMIGLDTATIERDGAGWRQVSFTGDQAPGDEKLRVPHRLPFFHDHEPGFFTGFGVTQGGRKQAKADDLLRLETEAGDIGGEAKPWIVAHGEDNLENLSDAVRSPRTICCTAAFGAMTDCNSAQFVRTPTLTIRLTQRDLTRYGPAQD
jgi:hypothetical protein